jgi:hypothetical protein
MSRLQDLQRSLFDLVLAPDAQPFLADPGAWGAARGLGADDQASLRRGAPRFAVYRELVQFALTDPVEDCYPILMAHLVAQGAWTECLAAFLEARVIQGPYYREVAPAFLQWLADSGWGSDRWPFLLPLAHWEHLELELLRHPEEALPTDLSREPDPAARVVPESTLRNLSYPVRVSEADPENPVPPEGALHLLAWRDAEGAFRSLELSAPASALVARWLEGQPLGAAAAELDLEISEALDLARRLLREGALVGFR